MNYLSFLPEPQKTKMTVHPKIAVAFEQWLLNDGYQPKLIVHAGVVHYVKSKKPKLEINNLGAMNEATQKRYKMFLLQYFKKGHSFIQILVSQAPKILAQVA